MSACPSCKSCRGEVYRYVKRILYEIAYIDIVAIRLLTETLPLALVTVTCQL